MPLTTEQKLERLCTAGEAMRKLQNAYFAEKIPSRKAEKLVPAKAAEAEFDRILREVRQLSLFA